MDDDEAENLLKPYIPPKADFQMGITFQTDASRMVYVYLPRIFYVIYNQDFANLERV